MVRHLHELGHCASPTMHSWHCRCEHCDATDAEYLFHAQTDSSCSGEVISHILHHDPDHARHGGDVFNILQAAALEVDAEPGMGAGFHVHVGMTLSQRRQARALWAFIRTEPLLLLLASGRFGGWRGNNDVLAGALRFSLAEWADMDAGYGFNAVEAIRVIDGFDSDRLDEAMSDLFYGHTDNDRHSNLNISTGHGTWEFRLWNSTRAAWRMEMFTRLSVALVDPAVVDRLIEAPLPDGDITEFDPLVEALIDTDHTRAAELVMRQVEYLDSGAAQSAPSTFTLT